MKTSIIPTIRDVYYKVMKTMILMFPQNGKYKCGGAHQGNDETTNTCVQWNPQSGTWTKSHDLIQPRQIHVTWVTASGVYLIGGWNSPTTTEIINDGGQVREGFSLKYMTR